VELQPSFKHLSLAKDERWLLPPGIVNICNHQGHLRASPPLSPLNCDVSPRQPGGLFIVAITAYRQHGVLDARTCRVVR